MDRRRRSCSHRGTPQPSGRHVAGVPIEPRPTPLGGSRRVELILGRAEERIFDQDLSTLADPEKESVFEGLTPPRQLLDGTVQTPDDVNAAVERTDFRWRLDAIYALIDCVD